MSSRSITIAALVIINTVKVKKGLRINPNNKPIISLKTVYTSIIITKPKLLNICFYKFVICAIATN